MPANRNPGKPQRYIEANRRKTAARVEQYYGKVALLNTWESQPDDVRADNHDYIIRLRATVRNVRNYILNRSGPASDIILR